MRQENDGGLLDSNASLLPANVQEKSNDIEVIECDQICVKNTNEIDEQNLVMDQQQLNPLDSHTQQQAFESHPQTSLVSLGLSEPAPSEPNTALTTAAVIQTNNTKTIKETLPFVPSSNRERKQHQNELKSKQSALKLIDEYEDRKFRLMLAGIHSFNEQTVEDEHGQIIPNVYYLERPPSPPDSDVLSDSEIPDEDFIIQY